MHSISTPSNSRYLYQSRRFGKAVAIKHLLVEWLRTWFEHRAKATPSRNKREGKTFKKVSAWCPKRKRFVPTYYRENRLVIKGGSIEIIGFDEAKDLDMSVAVMVVDGKVSNIAESPSIRKVQND